jgi:cell division protein FtsW (lipid II flippase)
MTITEHLQRQWPSISCIVASLLLTAFSLAFAESDLGAVLCLAIALVTGLLLLILAVADKGRRRFATLALALYMFVPVLLLTHYSLTRDHVRWFLLSRAYTAEILAQPVPTSQQFKHAAWDGWGFGGEDTTVYLVFDPTDSLAEDLGAQPPIKARGLPCSVVRVRRLDSQWYAVLFYTDTYWGLGGCK